jgi:hypothetical protein
MSRTAASFGAGFQMRNARASPRRSPPGAFALPVHTPDRAVPCTAGSSGGDALPRHSGSERSTFRIAALLRFRNA